jgi:hypothetical protein
MWDDVLAISIRCRVMRVGSAAFLLLGEASDAWAAAQHGRDISPWLETRVLFGLPVYTMPNPILIKSVVAERGTEFRSLTCYSWIEDNFMTEPRAEVLGVTPYGDDPLIFLRDCDLDRPPQCCVQNEPGQPYPLLLLAGAVWVDGAMASDTHMLEPDAAAMTGMQLTLPDEVRDFADLLRSEVAGGLELRKVLKTLRKQIDPNLTHFAEGWRVISRAAPMAHIGHADPAPDGRFAIPALAPPPPPKDSPRKRR